MAPQNDEANLARIRDNQRRSRARRKAYQQELEQRVRVFEELGAAASAEVQKAARRVAVENRALRALLRQRGVSHAGIEAFLRTGDASEAAPAAASLQALERLMVPRFPSGGPSGSSVGSRSAPGSVGPSSPAGGGRSKGWDAPGPPSESSASPAPASPAAAATASEGLGGGSDDNSNYLAPDFGLATALSFYGLDAASAEDLQYAAAEPAFFDYSASPHYLGAPGGGRSSSMPGMRHSPVPAPAPSYSGQIPGLMAPGSGSRAGEGCAACMAGMGCQAHGGL